MMKVASSLKQFTRKNGSTILTCVGIAGVVGTSVLTAKATIKAVDILKEAETDKGEALTVTEKVRVTLPVYIPPVLMGIGTAACILGANTLNKKHQASLISAYGMLDQSFKDYTKKVEELYGVEATERVEEELAKDNCPR